MESEIDFSTERWEKVKSAHRQWWANELDRPLVIVNLHVTPSTGGGIAAGSCGGAL